MKRDNPARIAPMQQYTWPSNYTDEIITTGNPQYQLVTLSGPTIMAQREETSPAASDFGHYQSPWNKNEQVSKIPKTPKKTSFGSISMIIIGVLFFAMIVAALSVGIYAVVILGQTTTTTITKMTMTTLSTTTTTTTRSLPSQCSSYTPYNDPTRLFSAIGGSLCDQNNFNTYPSLTWIRFLAPGGTEIPTSATNFSRCGTSYSGWYTGTMPTPSLTTSGTVCYAFPSSDCLYYNSISVTNCGSYYVYGLVEPPICNARYCTI